MKAERKLKEAMQKYMKKKGIPLTSIHVIKFEANRLPYAKTASINIFINN